MHFDLASSLGKIDLNIYLYQVAIVSQETTLTLSGIKQQ